MLAVYIIFSVVALGFSITMLYKVKELNKLNGSEKKEQ